MQSCLDSVQYASIALIHVIPDRYIYIHIRLYHYGIGVKNKRCGNSFRNDSEAAKFYSIRKEIDIQNTVCLDLEAVFRCPQCTHTVENTVQLWNGNTGILKRHCTFKYIHTIICRSLKCCWRILKVYRQTLLPCIYHIMYSSNTFRVRLSAYKNILAECRLQSVVDRTGDTNIGLLFAALHYIRVSTSCPIGLV